VSGYSGKPVVQKLGIKPGVTEAKGLAARLRDYRKAIAPDGMIWVSWPKKSSGVVTDLTDVVVRDTALPLGLVDIKVCAIDDTWSGLKFVIPKDPRTGLGAGGQSSPRALRSLRCKLAWRPLRRHGMFCAARNRAVRAWRQQQGRLVDALGHGVRRARRRRLSDVADGSSVGRDARRHRYRNQDRPDHAL
jgi:hypothetical protein